jgi:nucleoside-diphosphate kinase
VPEEGANVDQRTYVMIKPDAVARGLVGTIVARFEATGLRIERMERGVVTAEQAAANYAEHEGKPFYRGLIDYITSGPVVKMVLAGPDAVVVCRKLMGATNPRDAAPGTIRGDFGLVMDANVVHGSDSPESAEREIAIFFGA